MNHVNSSYQDRRTGFTVFELVVTMAISSVILLTLAALLTQTTEGYVLSQRSMNHLSQARAFVQLFQSDLSKRLPGTSLIHRSPRSAGSQVSDQIAFVRTIANDEQNPDVPGDLVTVCYYVAFVEESNQRVIPKLFRKILNPRETQQLMEAGDGAEFPEVDPSRDESVIDSVLGFRTTPMDDNSESGSCESSSQSAAHPPSCLEVVLRTVDESLSLRLTNPADWIRLASAPKESELQFIREVSQKLSIGK
jgi:type II secretory pathway component PulJ